MRRGQIPLINISTTDKEFLKIETTAAGLDTPYAALSHVRPSGLRNRRSNTLPICQVWAILRMMSERRGKMFGR